MSAVEERLGQLGLGLPPVAAPVAAYIPAVEHAGLVYTSGQLPFIEGALPETGKVGAEVSDDAATEYAAIATLNALAAVKSVVGDLDRVTRVVKVTVFVASAPDFTGQPAVANGASELLGEAFGEAGVHVRSAVGVAVLPLDSPVELEIVVAVEDGPRG
ncbi:RidA family protein [Pseudoclavibacter chungangensis]|uniref:RidA family protein n=1 Tax=Pseudoclavibacter chungangensis TaxID=587635 RepID=A0A7J5BR49_9MICO|nr:RidA family protein [Pseudoclavibacter chungangensis]KAB1656763.1 RidA family protein [Pseudoclavibacter chungangensis]NYJ67773.1 enamine deaminase RidA (YjgF/YER057c/UK114 family) [Pseudoclavibacter chungangensis]